MRARARVPRLTELQPSGFRGVAQPSRLRSGSNTGASTTASETLAPQGAGGHSEKRRLVDLQVNGYGGVDFSAAGLTLDDVHSVVRALADRRTEAFCPTVITSALGVYEANLRVLAEAIDQPDLAPHVLGIHLEGPFISPEDGARGAHPLEHVAAPSVDLFDRLQAWANGKVVMLTLAPDQPGALAVIRRAVSTGVTVSLGHHLADADQIREAADAGATACTHLGNGIPNLLPRHPNPIWSQLDEDRLTAMIISDGHHLPEAFIRTVLRVKSIYRVVVVSDSAPIAGFPPGRHRTLGQEVVLEESGRLWNPLKGHLVGSSACLADCLDHLARVSNLSFEELTQVGRSNPLALIARLR